MQTTLTQLASWRDGAFVTPNVAAEIIGYSTARVRELVHNGILKAVRPVQTGPMRITVSSLAKYVDDVERLTAIHERRVKLPSGKQQPSLMLVVNNG